MQEGTSEGVKDGQKTQEETLIDISEPQTKQAERERLGGRKTSKPQEIVDSISLSSDDSMPGINRRRVPRVNCPEKIVSSDIKLLAYLTGASVVHVHGRGLQFILLRGGVGMLLIYLFC